MFSVTHEPNFINYLEEIHFLKPMLWDIIGLLFPWMTYGNLTLQIGGISNLGHENMVKTRTREKVRWKGPGATVNYIRVLSSERAPHINKPATV
jgi:hypothetical protein